MIPIQYNVRSLLVRKTTTIAAGLGIGAVVFVLAAAMMLTNSIARTMGASGSDSVGIVLRQGSDAELSSNIEHKNVNLILAAPGIARGADGTPLGGGELIVVIALEPVAGEPGQISNVSIRGVPHNFLAYRPEIRVIEGRPPQPGTDEIMVGKKIARRFRGVNLGGQFDIRKNRPLKVVGVFSADGSAQESEVIADIETVRTSFGREGLVSSVTAKLASPSTYESFETVVEQDKQLGLMAMRQSEYYEKQSSAMGGFILIIAFSVAILFGLAAAIGAAITMFAAVSQRKREIGTLRALGFSRGAILGSFLLEAVVLAGIGGIVGAASAMAMSAVSFSMINMQTWAEVVFSFDPTPGIVISAVIAGCGMGILGGVFPAVKAAKTSPIEAMRG